MKVTFPHLGSMHIYCKAIAETAGIPYIVPPESSRKTLTLGVNLKREHRLFFRSSPSPVSGFKRW